MCCVAKIPPSSTYRTSSRQVCRGTGLVISLNSSENDSPHNITVPHLARLDVLVPVDHVVVVFSLLLVMIQRDDEADQGQS